MSLNFMKRHIGKAAPRSIQALVIVAMLLVLLLPNAAPTQAFSIPTFSIVKVVKDTSVTIRTANFPADELFTVRMGEFGTLGVGGVIVATTNSGSGGAFEATYDIPDSLKGLSRIAIRLDGDAGDFSYNWFWNNAGTSSGSVAIPTFSILEVVTDSTVKIHKSDRSHVVL